MELYTTQSEVSLICTLKKKKKNLNHSIFSLLNCSVVHVLSFLLHLFLQLVTVVVWQCFIDITCLAICLCVLNKCILLHRSPYSLQAKRTLSKNHFMYCFFSNNNLETWMKFLKYKGTPTVSFTQAWLKFCYAGVSIQPKLNVSCCVLARIWYE